MAPLHNLLCFALTGLHRCQNNFNPGKVSIGLDYATYVGTRLPNGVNQFLGMRYAAAPLGDLRWRAARDPVVEADIQPATEVTFLYKLLWKSEGIGESLICIPVASHLPGYQCRSVALGAR
jgi:Carboxylesterase family